MSLPFYVYQADVYCEACAEEIKRVLTRQGDRPAHPEDEETYDSDDYPKGPIDGDTSDSPMHCGSGAECLEPTVIAGEKYGKFLENALSEFGKDDVRERHANRPTEVTAFWMEFYGLESTTDTCPSCGDDLDRDCHGELRCPTCDPPCPHCSDQ